MEKVRAKFKVVENDGASVKLEPVASGSRENEEFYKWTPAGEIRLSTVNEGAIGVFEIGKEFYVDFVPGE